jgi:hypothetical protein
VKGHGWLWQWSLFSQKSKPDLNGTWLVLHLRNLVDQESIVTRKTLAMIQLAVLFLINLKIQSEVLLVATQDFI